MPNVYCLETSFLVDFLRIRERAVNKYEEIRKEKLETTSIVAWEILRSSKLGKTKEYKKLLDF